MDVTPFDVSLAVLTQGHLSMPLTKAICKDSFFSIEIAACLNESLGKNISFKLSKQIQHHIEVDVTPFDVSLAVFTEDTFRCR